MHTLSPAHPTTEHERSPDIPAPRLAAIYARVSTTEQADKGYSLPTQIEACRTLAQREGYTVPDDYIFVDDYTGTSLNRPQLTRLRDAIRQHHVHAIIVHDLDRLSRKLAHQLLLTEEFEQAGILLHVVTMPAGEKTPETQLLSHVRGIIAEYERAKILERTARGRRGRAQAGHVPYGRRTFGYVYVKHAGKGAHYIIQPEEAALVQRIFRLYLTGQYSLETIAATLTHEDTRLPAQDARTLPARVWHRSTIASFLRNTAYIGTMYEGKTKNLPGKRNPDKKTRHRMVPREEWIAVPVPPIIGEATFQAAQEQLVQNKLQATRNRKYAYLFINGRLRCGQCGRAMVGVTNGAGYSNYRCTRPAHHDVIAPHNRRTVQATAIEPVVWDAILRTLNNPARIATAVEEQQADMGAQLTALDRERQQYDRQIAQCVKDIRRWEQAYVGEAITLDDFKGKKAEIDARRVGAEQELARLDAQQATLEQQELETTALVDYCAQVRAGLHHFTIDEQRLALQALSITVTWHPTQPLQIHGRIPVDIVSNSST